MNIFYQLANQLLLESDLVDNKKYIDYIKEFYNILGKEYKIIDLGNTKEGEVYLFHPVNMSKKRILIIAGQHGEENSGPWALLHFIKYAKDLLKNASVSFLPIENVRGFKVHRRNDGTGQPTNWVLDKKGKMRDRGEISKILKDNFKLLRSCSKDGLLNLHEDNESTGFYLYVNGNINSPIVKSMLETGKQYFDFKRDGEYTDNRTYELKNGIIDNLQDGSLDDALYKNGTVLTITLEIPDNNIPLENRILFGSKMTEAFLNNFI